jgi:hypothetical protein
MRIGQKVTVLFAAMRNCPPWVPPTPFLRCYVIRPVSNGWQLYDPVRNWSWGLKTTQEGSRVIFG